MVAGYAGAVAAGAGGAGGQVCPCEAGVAQLNVLAAAASTVLPTLEAGVG